MTPSEYHQLFVDLLKAVETNLKNGHLDAFESKISTTLCGRSMNIETYSDWMRAKGTREIRFREHLYQSITWGGIWLKAFRK